MIKNSLYKTGKKAQFYLFVSILICISAYGLLSTSITAKEKNTDFDVLSSNYIIESKNVINQALYKRSDPLSEVDAFTLNFIDYAKTKNTNLGITYILKKENKTHIVNYLKYTINITSHNKTINKSASLTLNLSSFITLRYDETDYNYTFTNDTIEFKALLVK